MADMYAELFDRIILGKYAAGTKLKEDELSSEFGISRTPVREILRQLAQDGLVEIQPKRSAKVIGFTADDIEEIYEIRRSLEIQALRYSAPFLNIQGLKEIRKDIQKSAETDDVAVLMQADEKLHNYFISASGKRRLIAILDQMYRLIHHFRELGFKIKQIRDNAVKVHLAIIDALSMRDIASAEHILDEHLSEGKRTAISHIINGL